jgi:5-(carboxyamino)imidazole ribonucleotide synthase
MMNVLENASFNSDREGKLRRILDLPGVHLHWYNKKGRRPGRKIGHVTITGSTMEKILPTAEIIREILN